MPNSLSIRSYTRQKRGHAHPFPQLVLPLRGVIRLDIDGSYSGKVTPGECVMIKTGVMHYFTADEHAKFVVVDLKCLPKNLENSNVSVFTISAPLMQFLSFIEEQLSYQRNPSLEQQMFSLFYQLLSEQRMFKQFDNRVRNVVDYMEAHLSDVLTIDSLAEVACLSPTQLKTLFKKQTSDSVMQYLTNMRMERAKALLLNTDYPIPVVAEKVGYRDPSAFSRRFSLHFGLSPSNISA
ncbi:helix-turn-helix domain-containing protein [Vibrio amylolyticus]|uniref:AraC family transcriptional regulator n=2 Tax=Vibrio amylolyticus TaxID=2847292 RepID=UPI00354BEB94